MSLGTWLKSFALRAAGEEHARAMQSHQILEIANETLPYLRMGLESEGAARVADIILERTDAIAIALTDLEKVVAFSGPGSDHHKSGSAILTKATKAAIAEGKRRVLHSSEDVGCPEPGCPLEAAIVAPLELRGKVAGALKFYYSGPSSLTEDRITVAEGLARLLGTQLELSEIDRQKELACRAELRALQAQINPHFLFNTLNAIAMFCRTDPEEARRLLIRFSDFFRKSLEWRDELIPLDQELGYIDAYLDLERARFGDRLDVVEEIERDVRSERVPALSLQPLVENAVKHGLTDGGKLTIKISARASNGNVAIAVEDDGAGISPGDVNRVLEAGYGSGSGIGLSNVNERLKGHFGPEYRLDIESELGRGTTVRLSVPIEVRLQPENGRQPELRTQSEKRRRA